ncbi:RraA family protein [Galbitalea soli]|uniref:Putative 4-hydroxy-4-methyl-2-oxoglutarate aldolase n=1 Tax=Galbitalea soli TaxID=1268042 RepID=A0A7C9PMV1_9MICO|nr:RraA family protein [Galbitalea soli]NYJ29834.1 regulator of RNase E activity RraA [Galbitalea soli]
MSDAAPTLSTATVIDAVVRLGLPPSGVPAGVRSVARGSIAIGPAAPVTHLGSVDVFLEVIADAAPGSVLVVDNGGRGDEACVGDLITLEAKLAGLAGIVIWGLHRDTAQLIDIGLPVFSLGSFPRGPIRTPPAAPPMRSATVAGTTVRPGDHVVADDDGVVFVPAESWERVSETALAILQTEQAQATRMTGGRSLREQVGFADYLAIRAEQPGYSLRDHLRARGGAVET